MCVDDKNQSVAGLLPVNRIFYSPNSVQGAKKKKKKKSVSMKPFA